MKNLKYLLVGVLFGITLSKAEVISWFRIYEMFKLQSFHMFGVIGTAVVLGFFIMRGFNSKLLKSATGAKIRVEEKKKGTPRNLIGGIIFGLGWALGGACPGPIFILVGKGVVSILVVLLGALLGALLYHMLKFKLPHYVFRSPNKKT